MSYVAFIDEDSASVSSMSSLGDKEECDFSDTIELLGGIGDGDSIEFPPYPPRSDIPDSRLAFSLLRDIALHLWSKSDVKASEDTQSSMVERVPEEGGNEDRDCYHGDGHQDVDGINPEEYKNEEQVANDEAYSFIQMKNQLESEVESLHNENIAIHEEVNHMRKEVNNYPAEYQWS